MKIIPEPDKKKAQSYLFGRDYFGSFLYGFSRWLYRETQRNKYRKVFFFSRDGFMMEKGFNILSKGQIENEYVYFSRKSLSQALLWKCENFESIVEYMPWERYYSVGKILSFLGFTEPERLDISDSHHMDLQREIPRSKISVDSQILSFFQEGKEIIKERSKEQDDLLSVYLDQIDMRGQCAIVDIGWHGSMQFYLEQFVKQHKREVELNGYYVGINPTMPVKSSVNGYIFTGERSTKRKRLLCFLGGYERMFQGFDGSTSGYKLSDRQKVEPVLLPYEYSNPEDRENIQLIQEWQRGALDYVTSVQAAEQELDDEVLTEPLIHFGMNPTLRDTRMFSSLYNYDGTKAYYTAQKSLLRYQRKEFIHALSNSPWKTGFMKSAFKIPFPYYWIYEMIRK